MILDKSSVTMTHYVALRLSVNMSGERKARWYHRLLTLIELLFPSPISVIRWMLWKNTTWRDILVETAIAPVKLVLYLTGGTDECNLWEYKSDRT